MILWGDTRVEVGFTAVIRATGIVEGVTGQGRKIRVTFEDGEVLAGFCMGYSPDRLGFFVVPADTSGNNNRVFVVNAGVKDVAWA